MRLIIDISEYNAEYIKNAYGIPQDINMIIAESIINGKQVPTPHGRLIDADELSKQKYENIWTNRLVINADDLDDAPTVIKAED